MDKIVLSGKRELDIYINPRRQDLLRCMRISGVPMTPKQLAGKMGVSPSSIQHHLRKLMEIGLVELSHTERIHGITASYYRAPPKTVSIGSLIEDKNKAQRLALMQSSLSRVFSGYAAYCEEDPEEAVGAAQYGDMLSGIIRLDGEEAKALYSLIRAFLDAHEQSGGGGDAWEYALIAYPVAEAENA